jgi:hypothetical protein
MIQVFQGAATAFLLVEARSSLAESARRGEGKQPREMHFITYSLQMDVHDLFVASHNSKVGASR